MLYPCHHCIEQKMLAILCKKIDICSVCGGKSMHACKDCHLITYCGENCQKHDWKHGNHKEVCDKIQSIQYVGGKRKDYTFSSFKQREEKKKAKTGYRDIFKDVTAPYLTLDDLANMWRAARYTRNGPFLMRRYVERLTFKIKSFEDFANTFCHVFRNEFKPSAVIRELDRESAIWRKWITNVIIKGRVKFSLVVQLLDPALIQATIKTLSLYNELSAEKVRTLSIALKKNTTLQELKLLDLEINDLGAIALADALKENTALKSLNLRYNEDLSFIGHYALADMLVINTTRESIDLSATNFGKDSFVAFGHALKVNNTLRHLFIKYHDINLNDIVMSVFMEALTKNTGLLTLDMEATADEGDRIMNASWANALAKVLETNFTLQILNFRRNYMSGKELRRLAEALKGNKSLRELVISPSDENMYSEGLEALFTSVLASNTLQTLEIRAYTEHVVEVSVDATKALVRMLSKINTLQRFVFKLHDLSRPMPAIDGSDITLRYLNMESCNLGDHGASWLSNILENNTTLKTLTIRNNNIKEDGAKWLSMALARNKTLQTLNVSKQNMGIQGNVYLAISMKLNVSIRKLVMINTGMDEKGMFALAAALKMNTTLEKLIISRNKITDKGMEKIARALKENTTLHTFIAVRYGILSLTHAGVSSIIVNAKNLRVFGFYLPQPENMVRLAKNENPNLNIKIY